MPSAVMEIKSHRKENIKKKTISNDAGQYIKISERLSASAKILNSTRMNCISTKFKTLPYNKPMKLFDVDWHRLPLYVNVCITLLRAGYIDTFTEIFELNSDYRLRKAYWSRVPGEAVEESEQVRNLKVIVAYLTESEREASKQNYDAVYTNNHAIAEYFLFDKNHQWIAKHFLYRCHEIAVSMICYYQKLVEIRKNDPDEPLQLLELAKRQEVEALYHLITYYKFNGEYVCALKYARRLREFLLTGPAYQVPVISLQEGTSASDTKPQKQSLLKAVCATFCQCILNLHHLHPADSPNEQLVGLKEALGVAEQAEDNLLIGSCKKLISQVYLEEGILDAAQQYALEYYLLTSTMDDRMHRVDSCTLLARILQTNQETIGKAAAYLSELESLAGEMNNPTTTAQVAMQLVAFYGLKSCDHMSALASATRGFQAALDSGSQSTVNQLRLWSGVARGKLLQTALLPMVVAADVDTESMVALLNWRVSRQELPQMSDAEFQEKTKCTFATRSQLIQQRLSGTASRDLV